MKLITKCPVAGCGKVLELQTSVEFSESEVLNQYTCGHSFIEERSVVSKDALVNYPTSSCDGSLQTRDYQNEAIEFVLNTRNNCLIADQMGLGKTIEALLAVRAQYETVTPVLILVKSATVYQWIGEYKKWCDPLPLGIFMIEGSKSWIPPGFKTYIVSMDTFGRIISNVKEAEKLLTFGFKMLIVDEIHSFKNASSKRTQALISFIKQISHREITKTGHFHCIVCDKQWSEEIKIEIDSSTSAQTASHFHQTHCSQCTARVVQRIDKTLIDQTERERIGLIFLSGTPIKNRADEYFVPLNLLAPDHFPSLERFRRKFLVKDGQKYSHVKDYMLDEFRRTIAPFVIRRERKDVLKDLPKFTRTFTTVYIDDQNLKDAYNAEIEKLQLKNAEGTFTQADIQDNIFTMRRIIGMAKVKFASNYIKEFIDESENEKIAVGIHHHSVRDALVYELGLDGNTAYKPVKIDANKDIQYNVDKWKNPNGPRVGVISQLGGGVGLNLQFCSHILNIERQWNSADEEQLEDRFNRFGQTMPVTAEYLIAKGTIDVWFSNMVEDKRIISGQTYGINFDPMSSKELMKEMLEWAMVNKL